MKKYKNFRADILGAYCALGVKLHLKLTQDLHLILTHLVRSSITHFVGFLPVISSR
jgi:hypothetical protein